MFEQTLSPVLEMANSRYGTTIENLEEGQLTWRAAPGSNSIGFLIRHIAEVEYRFCAMYFQSPLPAHVVLTTIGPVKDEGIHTQLAPLLAFKEEAAQYLRQCLRSLPEEAWDIPCEGPLGQMTPREALARLASHTSYHAGQIALIRKYGGSG